MSTSLAVVVDDRLLVPQFEGQRKDNLWVVSNEAGQLLVHWTDEIPYPQYGTFQRYSKELLPLGPAIDVSTDMLDMGYKYIRSMPGYLPDGRLLAIQRVKKDSFFVEINDSMSLHRTYLQVFDTLGNTGPPVLLGDTLDWWLHVSMQARGLVVDTDGTINVLFRDYNLFIGKEGELYLARYDTAGNGLGPWEYITDCPSYCGDAAQEELHGDGFGKLVAVWEAHAPDLVMIVPYFRVYQNGLPVSEPTAFTCGREDTTFSDCWGAVEPCQRGQRPSATLSGDGSLALVFESCWQPTWDDSATSVWFYLFDEGLSRIIGPVRLEDFATHVAIVHPRVRVDADSGYVVSWIGFPWHPMADMFLQRVNPEGEKLGLNYRVNSPIGTLQQRALWGLDVHEGEYTSVWFDGREWDPYLRDIYGQVVPREMVGTRTDGDVNYDGFVNSSDIIYLVNYVFKSGYPPYGFLDGGDINGNCTTNSADIIALVNYIFKGGAAPLEPCSE